MNKRNWTPEQLDAINVESGAVLVSAAAGSGKTSVLVQRVIRKIIDKKNPVDINKLLIVTFTNAAAQEMKTRISQKLSELIEQEPNNLNLQRQKMLLKSTQIGTIHSFCNNIIKENFFKLGISPNFKISNDSDLLDLTQKALENTLDFFFEQENPVFYDLLDLFGNEKNNTEKFKNIILDIYKFTESVAFPQKWFFNILNMYTNSTNNNNIWQEYILDYAREKINQALTKILESIEIIKNSKELEEKYLTFFEEEFNNIQNIKEVLNNSSWNNIIKHILNFNFTRLKSFKIIDSIYEKEIMISKRNEAKDIIDKIKNCLCWTQEEIQNDINNIRPKIELIFNIINYFSEELTKFKIKKNVLSFSDLEHLCLKLLIDNNNQKSDIACNISEQFDEIMIDEYQDINEVQDAIFRLVSRNEKNIFMVGDVKQSIYGFRQSRPEIFLNKKNKYKIYHDNIKEPTKIILSKNFRSDKEIINSVNFVFENLMSKKTGDIEYNNEEKLTFGSENIKTNQNPDTSSFNIKLIDISEVNNKELEEISEAREVAKTVKKLVTIQKYNYKDICILLRKTKNSINIYKKELENFGIPVTGESTEEFLSTPEILTITSILQFVNNPVDDISLTATMLNPLFGFTLEGLTDIRMSSREVPMYFALKKYAENNKNIQKIQNFVQRIENYREISINSSCDELIDYIYQDTNILKVFYNLNNGKLKKANLLLFRDYARKFSKDTQKSLLEFLEYIKNIQSKNSDLPCANVQVEDENTVKIMSIHKSKGLEFPVCILAGTSSKFVQNTDSVLLHPKLGIGMKLRDKKLNFVYDNIIRKSISIAQNRENISEELRVLYVALTRAKNMIYITSSIKNINKFIEKILCFQNNNLISEHDIQSASSFWDWIFLCITKSSVRNELCKILNLNTNLNILEKLNWKIDIIKPDLNIINKNIENNNIIYEKSAEKTKKFEYTNKINLPVRTTVSQISHKNIWYDNIATEYPDFMHEKSISSAARGTLLHKFMCCCDLKNIKQDLDSELERLVKLNFFSKKEISFLDKLYIKNFTKSEIYTRIINSPEILREYKFSVKIPVKNFDENQIIVQGAIDCIFLENNNYVIIDYKTDRLYNKHEFIDKYFVQLDIYKQAVEQIKNINIKEIGIYSFFNSEYYKI